MTYPTTSGIGAKATVSDTLPSTTGPEPASASGVTLYAVPPQLAALPRQLAPPFQPLQQRLVFSLQPFATPQSSGGASYRRTDSRETEAKFRSIHNELRVYQQAIAPILEAHRKVCITNKPITVGVPLGNLNPGNSTVNMTVWPASAEPELYLARARSNQNLEEAVVDEICKKANIPVQGEGGTYRQINDIHALISTSRQDIEILKKKLSETSTELLRLAIEVTEKEDEIQKLRSMIAETGRKLELSQSNAAEAISELQSLTSILEERDRELDISQRNAAAAANNTQDFKKTIEDINRKLEQSQNHAVQTGSEVQNLLQMIEENKNILKRQSTEMERQSSEIRRQSTQMERQSAEMERQSAEMERQSAEIRRQSTIIDDLTSKAHSMKRKLEEP